MVCIKSTLLRFVAFILTLSFAGTSFAADTPPNEGPIAEKDEASSHEAKATIDTSSSNVATISIDADETENTDKKLNEKENPKLSKASETVLDNKVVSFPDGSAEASF